jgi:hypothetical protein
MLAASAVRIHDDDFLGACQFGAANGGVDFLRHQPAPFVVATSPSQHLLPTCDSADAFSVNPNHHPHGFLTKQDCGTEVMAKLLGQGGDGHAQ